MNLFTNKVCCYCQLGFPSSRNPDLFDGFRDLDTAQLVCFRCRTKHYAEKEKTEHKHKFSERPESLTDFNQNHGKTLSRRTSKKQSR